MQPFMHKNREYESLINKERVDQGLYIRELCEKAGVHQTTFIGLANGTQGPLYARKGTLKPEAGKLCEALGLLPEEAFPRYFCEIKPEGSNHFLAEGFVYDKPPTPEEILCQKELKEFLSAALKTLKASEERVIRDLYFRERSITQVARDFKITGTRVEQIHAKALGKLRHPSRSKKLWAWYSGEIHIASTPKHKLERTLPPYTPPEPMPLWEIPPVWSLVSFSLCTKNATIDREIFRRTWLDYSKREELEKRTWHS